MPYLDYLKDRVYALHSKGLFERDIVHALASQGLSVTRPGIAKWYVGFNALAALREVLEAVGHRISRRELKNRRRRDDCDTAPPTSP